jgi:hypothetical protein
MPVIYIIAFGLLILLVASGVCGLLFFKNYIKRICCLSVSYISFLILFALMAFKIEALNEIMFFATTLLIVFAINLFLAIGLVRRC